MKLELPGSDLAGLKQNEVCTLGSEVQIDCVEGFEGAFFQNSTSVDLILKARCHNWHFFQYFLTSKLLDLAHKCQCAEYRIEIVSVLMVGLSYGARNVLS